MADTVRTTIIKDVLLNVVIRCVFIRSGLSKTVAHANEVQNIDDPVAIDIRILFGVAIPGLSERTGDKHQVLDVHDTVFINVFQQGREITVSKH